MESEQPKTKPVVPNKEPAPAKAENKAVPKAETQAASKAGGKLAAILIRNTTAASPEARATLKMLGLLKKFTCVLVDNSKMNRGMLDRIKDYATYGEADDATIKMLDEKRGRKGKEGKPRKDFHLHPPRGGFERKGIKRNYVQGGALGYRGSKINDLIRKMV